MSDRMKHIKTVIKDRAEARHRQGGEWVRRGECLRCGACCDARNIDPESHKAKQAEMRAKGQLPEGAVLSSICGNHGVAKDGQLGCKLHGKPSPIYPPGCAAFPANVAQWRLVIETCGYWFEWVEDGPRAAGKARRARA